MKLACQQHFELNKDAAMAEREEDVEFRDTYVIPQQVERLQVAHVLPSYIGPTT